MDSLTQIVLGASVGEAVAGKKLGNKALLWGAIAGTIPDLDILLNPWLDMVEQLSFHRSVTHSLLFAILLSPLFAYSMTRIYKKTQASFIQWTLLFFLCFTTHALLDSFTTWGTQLFWPFSTVGVAFYNVSVIDPFYTVPFLFCVAAAALFSRRNRIRSTFNYAGLVISSGYLIFTFFAKSQANQAFEKNLNEQDILFQSYISKPTPFNAILWSVTAETKDGFYTGFYSLFDSSDSIYLEFEPKDWELLDKYRGNVKLERLLKVTRNYYSVDEAPEGLLIRDLRFGKFDGWRRGEGHYAFTYKLSQENQRLQFEEINYRPRPGKGYFNSYLNRVLGKKEGEF